MSEAASGDARATAAMVTRIASALITRSFRRNGNDWEAREDSDAVRDVLPPTLGRGDSQRPYFETLIVTGLPSERWSSAATEWRRLRRPLDAFVYDRPLLAWIVRRHFASSAAMLEISFDAQMYGIALPLGSSLRKPVDVAMLETTQSGWWRQTLFRYLGEQ